MATVLASSDRIEADLVRRALDNAGFAEGESPYAVALFNQSQSLGEGRTIVVLDEMDYRSPSVWTLLAAGVDEVMPWKDEETIAAIVTKLSRWREVDQLVASKEVSGLMVGRSPALRAALLEVVELAVYGSGPIVLVGETGTGKELAASLVHQVGGNSNHGRLVVLDCTTIVPSLSGSELFGHERGAFTGAERARGGAFAAANGGTLFLDEIGELPSGLQSELLRVLQEGTYKRVGGDSWAHTRFRLVSATNRDLAAEQAAGRFRSDLYHRIASGVVRLPPLRERRDDIEVLFNYFLREARHGEPVDVTAPVLAMLRDRPFPGNLRELRHLAFAVAARHAGDGPVTVGDVPPRDRPVGVGGGSARKALETGVRECLMSGFSLHELKAMVGDLAVDIALAGADGNVQTAASTLGVTDRAIQLRKRDRN